MAASAARKFLSLEFEIFGTVQGVFFRKHTKKTADSNGLVGWVKNTPTKTVVGIVQGPEDKINIMKEWLKTKGSPKSTIKRSVFKNEKSVDKLDFKNFDIRRH